MNCDATHYRGIKDLMDWMKTSHRPICYCQPRLRVCLVATRLRQCCTRRTAVRDHCTTTARPQRCRETCVGLWPAPTRPCFSGNDRAALAASRGTHTVQAVPSGSSYRHRQCSDVHCGSPAAGLVRSMKLRSCILTHEFFLLQELNIDQQNMSP